MKYLSETNKKKILKKVDQDEIIKKYTEFYNKV